MHIFLGLHIQGKSALWFHLVKYLEYQEGKSIPATPVNESNVPDENVPNSGTNDLLDCSIK